MNENTQTDGKAPMYENAQMNEKAEANEKRTINHNARKGTETLITPVLDICILRDHIILVSIKSGVSINSLINAQTKLWEYSRNY